MGRSAGYIMSKAGRYNGINCTYFKELIAKLRYINGAAVPNQWWRFHIKH